jgi:hypothetical protein
MSEFRMMNVGVVKFFDYCCTFHIYVSSVVLLNDEWLTGEFFNQGLISKLSHLHIKLLPLPLLPLQTYYCDNHALRFPKGIWPEKEQSHAV